MQEGKGNLKLLLIFNYEDLMLNTPQIGNINKLNISNYENVEPKVCIGLIVIKIMKETQQNKNITAHLHVLTIANNK